MSYYDDYDRTRLSADPEARAMQRHRFAADARVIVAKAKRERFEAMRARSVEARRHINRKTHPMDIGAS